MTITATPGTTPFTGLTNNKLQQLPVVLEGRTGSMPVTGMHEAEVLERKMLV
jgi:hypothetical protein